MLNKHPDGEAKLSDSTLRESLSSAYAEIAAVLRGVGLPPTRNLFEGQIPGIVFDIAVGARWVPLIPLPDDSQPQHARSHGSTLVQLGEFDVERWFADAFIELLREEIDYHIHSSEENQQEQLDNLPKFTSMKQREELLEDYLERHRTNDKRPKMIEVANWGGVDYSDFKKWRRGPTKLPDSSAKAKRIAMLLRHDDKSCAKRQKPRD
jgi:hypothetical protein